VRVFSTACDSVIVSKSGWMGDDSQKFLGEKRCETVRCRDATASSFVVKVGSEVFAHVLAVAVNRHSSMCIYNTHVCVYVCMYIKVM
jgi:hypothetical protein